MRRFLQVLMLLSSLGEGHPQQGCWLQGWNMESFSQPGDVLIGGVIVVHSGFDIPQLSFQDPPQAVSCKR
ncbi:hypothetical protein FKM82_010029 [Ascaphus truei]